MSPFYLPRSSGRINHGLVVVAFYFLEQYHKAHPELSSSTD